MELPSVESVHFDKLFVHIESCGSTVQERINFQLLFGINCLNLNLHFWKNTIPETEDVFVLGHFSNQRSRQCWTGNVSDIDNGSITNICLVNKGIVHPQQ